MPSPTSVSVMHSSLLVLHFSVLACSAPPTPQGVYSTEEMIARPHPDSKECVPQPENSHPRLPTNET
jgi:hypothetical protein